MSREEEARIIAELKARNEALAAEDRALKMRVARFDAAWHRLQNELALIESETVAAAKAFMMGALQ